MADKQAAYRQLKQDITAGTLGNLYIFHGEETYLREYYLSEVAKKLVPPAFAACNAHKVEGKGLTVEALTELVEPLPMMAERTLVQVVDMDLFKLPEGQRKALIALLSDFPSHCCLIFVYDQLPYAPNKTVKTLCKAIDAHVSVVQFDKQSRSDLLNWVTRRCKACGKSIDNQTAEHLIFTCGSLMNTLIPEIEKVCAYAKGPAVTKGDITAVAAPVLEAQVFDMTAALARRDFNRSAEILGTLLKLQEEPIMLLAVLGKELRKLYTARLAIDNGLDKFWLMKQWNMRSDYPAKLALEAAGRVSTSWAERAVARCQALDVRMKSVTGANSAGELKQFLMELGQEAEA